MQLSHYSSKFGPGDISHVVKLEPLDIAIESPLGYNRRELHVLPYHEVMVNYPYHFSELFFSNKKRRYCVISYIGYFWPPGF